MGIKEGERLRLVWAGCDSSDDRAPPARPHDYRVVCEHAPATTVVGGQAINLWAIFYLTPQVPRSTLVNKDLDIIVGKEGLARLERIPGWIFEPMPLKN